MIKQTQNDQGVHSDHPPKLLQISQKRLSFALTPSSWVVMRTRSAVWCVLTQSGLLVTQHLILSEICSRSCNMGKAKQILHRAVEHLTSCSLRDILSLADIIPHTPLAPHPHTLRWFHCNLLHPAGTPWRHP